MQDSAYGLPRITLPRTPLNKSPKAAWPENWAILLSRNAQYVSW